MDKFDKGHQGGCHCGAIRYRTVPHSGNGYICNCHFCQKATGGPFLVEHCFTQDEVEILKGVPQVHTHVSGGSGKEVYLHFCGDCGTHLYLSLERWPETRNIFTTTFDAPGDLGYGPDQLRYLFTDAAQSGTILPAGFASYPGHCDPADGSDPRETVSETSVLVTTSEPAEETLDGGCLCGAIRYRATGAPDFIVICHCRSCQVSLGSGMNFELLFDPDRFHLLQGSPRSYRHRGGSGQMVEKRFCGDCGSALWMTGDRFSEVGVFRGSLDHPNRVAVSAANAMQICLSEALPSAMVIAGIDCYDQHRRAPDGTLRAGQVPAHHRRVGDGARG